SVSGGLHPGTVTVTLVEPDGGDSLSVLDGSVLRVEAVGRSAAGAVLGPRGVPRRGRVAEIAAGRFSWDAWSEGGEAGEGRGGESGERVRGDGRGRGLWGRGGRRGCRGRGAGGRGGVGDHGAR